MKQAQLPRRPRAAYPWELSEETKAVGRAGLAKVRSILQEKSEGPAQQRLELDFSDPGRHLQSVPRRTRMAA
ncbi:MAG: hypothetical protein HKN03_15465 [Acidimicrobiales bacterium]|nr:hypothetical protein [Acidimicrobiales bacterium]